MAKGSLLLQPVLQFFDNSGLVLNGGKLYFYSPSTTTPKNTYTDVTKGVANANPVVLDSAGRPDNSGTPINIYLDGSYKLVVKDSAGNTIRTVDPVNTLGQLVNTRSTSSTDSIAVGDRDYILEADASSAGFTINVLAAATAGAGFRFGVQKIDSSSNLVTVDFNAAETCNGATTFVFSKQWDFIWFTSDGTQWIGEQNATFPSGITVTGNASISGNATVGGTLGVTGLTTLSAALNEKKGADIASATTTDIGAATGNYINVTGTTTITGLGTIQAGTRRVVNFNSVLTLTYNATSLILPGATNITTAAGDVAVFISLGSGNWVCTQYLINRSILALGTPISGNLTNTTNIPVAQATGILPIANGGVDQTAWAAWTPTLVGWSGSPTVTARYKVLGKTAVVYIKVTGTSNATSTSCSNWPVTTTTAQTPSFLGTAQDNGGTIGSGLCTLTANSTTATFYSTAASASWTASNTKSIEFMITCETT